MDCRFVRIPLGSNLGANLLAQTSGSQRSEWGLAPAEKDVSLLLLTGFSLNEIGE